MAKGSQVSSIDTALVYGAGDSEFKTNALVKMNVHWTRNSLLIVP